MDRWIAVALSVVFAVFATACDSESTASTDKSESPPTRSEKSAPESGDSGTHRTRTGLTFETPEGWSANMMPAGAKLIPPGGPKAKDSYLLVIRFAPDGTKDATDADYIDQLASDFTDRVSDANIATRETGLDNPMGPASYVAWNVEDGEATKRVGFFVTISGPWMLVLRATGPRSKVEKRRETVESIFATAELTDADVNPKLVGTWRRMTPRETEQGTYEQTLNLQQDGTMRLTHERSGKVSQKSLEDVGRWAAAGDTVIRYIGNSLQGGVQVKNHTWRIDGEGLLHLEGNSSSSTWKPVD